MATLTTNADTQTSDSLTQNGECYLNPDSLPTSYARKDLEPHPMHKHLSMQEFVEEMKNRPIHHYERKEEKKQEEVAEREINQDVFEEATKEIRISHRRDDQEIAHAEFKQTEENVLGIYIGITPFYRGQ